MRSVTFKGLRNELGILLGTKRIVNHGWREREWLINKIRGERNVKPE